MKSLLRSHYIITIIALAILFALGAGFVRFSSLLKERKDRVIDARDRLALFEQNKKIFNEESKQLETIKEHVSVLERHVVTEQSIPELLSSLETMAKTNALNFSITTVQSPNDSAQKRFVVSFSAKGALSNIDTFLSALLAQPYQIRFTRYTLSRSVKEAESTEVVPGAPKAPVVPPTQSWDLVAGIEIVSFKP